MFCLRHLPIVALLLMSCSVYSDSMLAGSSAVEQGGGASGRGGSGSIQLGGHSALGGSKDTAQQGGDGEQAVSGASNAAGGSSALGGAGQGASAGSPALGGSTATAGTNAGGMPNPPSGVDPLDDMEDGNFYLLAKPPRYGYWYVAGDMTASGGKLPTIGELIAALSPARAGSTSAVHFQASGFKGWGASLGLSFADAAQKRTPYDAGNAVGISFWVRGSITDNIKLRVLFPMLGTDPTGKLCGGTGQGQCLDHYATQIQVTSEWTQVSLLFTSLHQAGWGVPVGANFDPTQMLGVEWTAGVANTDVWIDDLALMRP